MCCLIVDLELLGSCGNCSVDSFVRPDLEDCFEISTVEGLVADSFGLEILRKVLSGS